MTIVAPDLLIPTAGALPVGYTGAPGRLIVETNGRGCTLAVLNGSAEARPVDRYGAVTGSETPITPGAPMTLAAAGPVADHLRRRRRAELAAVLS